MNRDNLNAGTITYYNPGHEKQYGFIQPDGSTNREDAIWFHNTRQVEFRCTGGDEPTETGTLIEPRVGDRVLYVYDHGPKGKRAILWAAECTYEQALHDIENRPTYRMVYRMGRKQLSRLWEAPIMETEWYGQNLVEFRRLFPKDYYQVHDRDMSGRTIEKLNNNDMWEECTDPR